MSRGNYISRVCIIHPKSRNCLYDRIRAGDEELWMNNDEKSDEDEYAMNIKFPVSGTKKERTMREELISLLVSFFQISRSIDTGSVFKAAFQKPAENRQSNFTVKFTPHFGTLARPKKNINTKISSMVFGQAQTEMVMASKCIKINNKNKKNNEELKTDNISTDNKSNNKVVCAVFYGVNCKPETATNLAKKLIDEFFVNFTSKLQRLLFRLEPKKQNDDDNDSDDNDMNNGNDVGMEYIMAQFKSFDEIVDRLATRHTDSRIQRKISNRRLYKINNNSITNNSTIKKHSSNNNTLNTKHTNTNTDTTNTLNTKSEDDDY